MFVSFCVHFEAFCHFHIASVSYFANEKRISQSVCIVHLKNVTYLVRM